ncbi:putative phosphate regulon protein [Bdellovibrio bacteriovorus W]|nr:putative phosphate regulon protein [Bdellovibrio bacteriovorus W]
MALRVLLADESSTIKKVMQLALADFAVEVKAVPVGLDVLSVAKTFRPDIVFADVLLTKRSGYEVCADLKSDPETAMIPVVLMWSGFMEIDEEKAQQAKVDRRLEKPFDAEHLRSLVTDLVSKTQSNPLKDFLNFPEMPDFEEPAPAQSMDSPSEDSVHALQTEEIDNVFAIPESHDEILDIPSDEEFAAVPLTEPRDEFQDEADEGGWAHQDLTKFKIQLPEEEENDFASKFVIPQDDELSNVQIEVAGDFEEISFVKQEPVTKTSGFMERVERSVKDQMLETLHKKPQTTANPETVSNAKPNTQSKIDLNSNMMENVVREEARAVIEAICWKVIPEIAERVIREEISKIMRETEKSI